MFDVRIYDTTLRDGTQREGISLSVGEQGPVAHLIDRLGFAFIEAGFPESNPKDAELFRALEAGPAAARADRGVRHDPPPWRSRRRGCRVAGARRVVRARS